MDTAAYTEVFAHLEQVMTAEAHERRDGWELLIRDGEGRLLCSWRPDAALLAGDADRIAPTVLRMLIAMVRNGALPLRGSACSG